MEYDLLVIQEAEPVDALRSIAARPLANATTVGKLDACPAHHALGARLREKLTLVG